MFTTEKFNRRMLNAGLGISAVAALTLAGCGSDGEDDEAEGTATGEVVESTEDEAPGTVDSLDITISGGLDGHITEFIGEPECSFRENSLFDGGRWVYQARYEVELDGEEFSFSILQNSAEASGDHTYEADDVNMGFYGPAPYRYTSFTSNVPVEGTVTINDDLTGTVNDVTIGTFSDSDYDADPITVNGSWSCAEFAGSSSDESEDGDA